MTITLAWVRENNDTKELVVASDSRLRSHGAMNETQKIFRLERGDCCLGFCGDTQVAYPVFIQVGSALNNYGGTRDRARDVTDVVDNIKGVLNNLIDSWDLPATNKAEELSTTKILFAGWSWRFSRFHIGAFRHENNVFDFHRERSSLSHPWRQINKSFLFLGDYRQEYLMTLAALLERRHGRQPIEAKKDIKFDYEPIEALAIMLRAKSGNREFSAIGGAPQVLKIYAHGNDLPVVTRIGPDEHYLFGRRLREWEKTTYPILDLTETPSRFIYPLSSVPLPTKLAADAAGTAVPDLSMITP